MVIPFDTGDAPLTSIWAIHDDTPHPAGQNPPNTPWRTIVVHWCKINYAAEKQKKPGQHPVPDFMGDVVDPRSAQKFPGNRLLNATIEGRLLGGKGGEMIRPIFRDDFCLWGHLEEGGKRWKILPTYFIPHGSGIEGLTATRSYKFNVPPPSKGPIITARMATRQGPVLAPVLQSGVFVFVGEDNQQGFGPDRSQSAGAGETGDAEGVIGSGKLRFDSADDEPMDDPLADAQDLQFLKQPLQEEAFGQEAAAADKAAAEHEKSW